MYRAYQNRFEVLRTKDVKIYADRSEAYSDTIGKTAENELPKTKEKKRLRRRTQPSLLLTKVFIIFVQLLPLLVCTALFLQSREYVVVRVAGDEAKTHANGQVKVRSTYWGWPTNVEDISKSTSDAKTLRATLFFRFTPNFSMRPTSRPPSGWRLRRV